MPQIMLLVEKGSETYLEKSGLFCKYLEEHTAQITLAKHQYAMAQTIYSIIIFKELTWNAKNVDLSKSAT